MSQGTINILRGDSRTYAQYLAWLAQQKQIERAKRNARLAVALAKRQ